MSEIKKIFTTPKVRKFARELGANLENIEGSERKGRITEKDVKKFVNLHIFTHCLHILCFLYLVVQDFRE